MDQTLKISRISELKLIKSARDKDIQIELNLPFFSNRSNKKWSSKINTEYHYNSKQTALYSAVFTFILGAISLGLYSKNGGEISNYYYLIWIGSVMLSLVIGKFIGHLISEMKLDNIIDKIRYHSNNQGLTIKN